MRETNKKLLIATLLIATVAASSLAVVHFGTPTEISGTPTEIFPMGRDNWNCTVLVDPAEVWVRQGENFTVDINVDFWGSSHYYVEMFDLEVEYNSSQMTPLAVIEGDFFGVTYDPPLTWHVDDNPDDPMDKVYCIAGGTNEGEKDGTLVTIAFRCNNPGVSNLSPSVDLYDDNMDPNYPLGWGGCVVHQTVVLRGELQNRYDIIRWQGSSSYRLVPFYPPGTPPGYAEIKTLLQGKGYGFDPAEGTALAVNGSIAGDMFNGTVMSWWSNNTLADGTRACILTAEIGNGTMAMAFVTNLLPPEQASETGPYLIVNAMPYTYVRFYWWAWYPIQQIVSWSSWWYDSASPPDWFWGLYLWWRTYVKAHYYAYTEVPYWSPWWGWWWHWIYWQHWHFWSADLSYDS